MKLVVLLTRFSLVNKNVSADAWISSRDLATIDYRNKILNDRERLSARLEIFEASLENIKSAQTESLHIEHVAVASQELPDWVKERLNGFAERFPWFRVKFVTYEEPVSYEEELKTIVVSKSEDILKKNAFFDVTEETDFKSEGFYFAAARLDDDDILSKKYFSKLAKYIAADFHDMCVSFPFGYGGHFDCKKKAYHRFSVVNRPLIAIGLAKINYFDSVNHTFSSEQLLPTGNHTTVNRRHPTILDMSDKVYIWSVHDQSDRMTHVSEDAVIKHINKKIGDNTVSTDEISREFVNIGHI